MKSVHLSQLPFTELPILAGSEVAYVHRLHEGTFSASWEHTVIFTMDKESYVNYRSQTILDLDLLLPSKKYQVHCQFSLDIIHFAKTNYHQKFT